jgi:glutathione S-transferase
MKLYYSPGACSQAPHIALREAGLPFDLVKVDLRTKRLESGGDYRAVNPKGSVPALGLDDGSVLTENAVVLQYIADRAPNSGLIPNFGTMERYRLLEWVNYITTELHKASGPLWNPATPEEARQATRDLLAGKYDYVQGRFGSGPHLTGDAFTIADAYLFVVLGWTGIQKIDLARWPKLGAFAARVAERPTVRAALHAEGLAGKA